MTYWLVLTSLPERELLYPMRLYSEYGFGSKLPVKAYGIELAYLQNIERRV